MTLESFEFQWKHLPEAPYLLSDPTWRANVAEHILEELESTRQELRGKRVLDAGMGQGRWAYGFQQLGCQVFGFDTSPSGVAYAKQHIQGGKFDVADILDLTRLRELYAERTMDLVWCWGVIHHTTHPKRALSNLTKFIKIGGKLHIYVYGRKSLTNKLLHATFNLFSLENRLMLAKILSKFNAGSPHGNFDAFSPFHSEHTGQEVESWFIQNGSTYKRVYPAWPSHGHSRTLRRMGIRQKIYRVGSHMLNILDAGSPDIFATGIQTSDNV